MPVYEVPRQVSEMIYPWQVEQKARIKEAERIKEANGSATKVLQRRQYRSFVENDEPLSGSPTHISFYPPMRSTMCRMRGAARVRTIMHYT